MNRLGIFPWPQWLNPQQGTFSVRGDGMSLWLGETCRPVLAGTTPVLDVWRVALPTTADAGRATVVIGGVHEPEVAARLSRHPGLLAEAATAEGYVLAVDDAGATIGGADARGCLYGLSTPGAAAGPGRLIGGGAAPGGARLAVQADAGRARLHARPRRHPVLQAPARLAGRAEVQPALPRGRWRHALRPPPGGQRCLGPLLRRGARLPWRPTGTAAARSPSPRTRRTPSSAAGRSLEKEEVADLVRYAKSLGIEVVPEMQSLSHAYYLVLAHPEIAERAVRSLAGHLLPLEPAHLRALLRPAGRGDRGVPAAHGAHWPRRRSTPSGSATVAAARAARSCSQATCARSTTTSPTAASALSSGATSCRTSSSAGEDHGRASQPPRRCRAQDGPHRARDLSGRGLRAQGYADLRLVLGCGPVLGAILPAQGLPVRSTATSARTTRPHTFYQWDKRSSRRRAFSAPRSRPGATWTTTPSGTTSYRSDSFSPPTCSGGATTATASAN